ncbi:DNA polymerase [Streptomyces sp. SM12]|uniref:DNA polymerase n=1 Tax=Streptomyces sp. SM12 TaxID=1071602 RepID=UPI000CD4A032|nr:DNA polymerase [Streptomyces sp. SM12]
MIEYRYRVAGTETVTRFAESREDLDEFAAWVDRVRAARVPIGADTETTGLDWYAPHFRVRTVQFGTETEAWVIPVELSDAHMHYAAEALRTLPYLVFHNAPYDGLVIDRCVPGVTLESLWPRIRDTRIRAHLVDPRMRHEGGMGLGLKDLSASLIDPSAPDTAAGLYAEFRKIKKTKNTGWAAIDVRNPLYVQYAGLDAILAARLEAKLITLLRFHDIPSTLVQFEHRVALICAQMMRRGMLLDEEYTRNLKRRLTAETAEQSAIAARYGVESVNAPKQVVEALRGMGEVWTETTDTGNPSVGKDVLLPLADLDRDWRRIGARTPNPLADAVLRAKRSGKWESAYADNMLKGMDAFGRIHPNINSLQARTARMSITGPALQTLPSGDWSIRRAMMADEGHRMISVDYAAVEMRVLAALAPEPVMIDAIANGRDLHDYTAELVYGKGFTKAHRKIAKAIGFGKVYGGGVATICRQTGAPRDDVANALREYDRIYRGIYRYSRRLQDRARWDGYVVRTPSGRRLPLDRDRVYAATNYVVQSSARDVLCQALVDLDGAGLGEHLLLPVHDEVVAQAPADVAEDVAAEIGRVMSMQFYGVPLATDAETGGRSWGSLYMDEATRRAHDPFYLAA